MSTKTKKIKNSNPKYNRLLKNLENQSTDTILEWKTYFKKCKVNPKCSTEYFTMAIQVCENILKERRENNTYDRFRKEIKQDLQLC